MILNILNLKMFTNLPRTICLYDNIEDDLTFDCDHH